MIDLDGKTILITGGTGSIGECLILRILNEYTPKVIRIYSRDETKQLSLAKKLDQYKKKDILRFFIGDIRDKERLRRAMNNVDIVFHLAALKHVGSCEYNPFEAIKTNIIGLQNLIEISIDRNIEQFVFTSTDKAATPSNTMGVTKLLGEKLVSAATYYKGEARTIFYSIRFGNVLGSRGSLIPLIETRIKNNLSITLTHKDMTRYVIGDSYAIDLILKTMDIAQGGEVFVSNKMNVVRIIDLFTVLIEHFASKNNKIKENIEIKEIGIFAGETLYEELLSIEESERTYEINDTYLIAPQVPEVLVKIDFKKYPNVKKLDGNKSYNSKEGPFLSKDQINEFLRKNNII